MTIRFLPPLCLLAAMLSLSRAAEAPALRIRNDLTYKAGWALTDYEASRCKLDVYTPKIGSHLPCLVWFHGGGLTAGDKAGAKTVLVARALAAEGLMVAVVNYRLSPKAKYPAYMEDAAASVAWVREHAADYGGDPKQVFVAGHSAGGYLTAMLGVDSHYLKARGVAVSDLAGFIPLSGQMLTHYTIREERGLPKTAIIADEAAPLHYAPSNTPPWLVLYAEKDMAMRVEENQLFVAALRTAKNQRVTGELILGHDHSGIGDRIAESDSPVRKRMLEFIRATVKEQKQP